VLPKFLKVPNAAELPVEQLTRLEFGIKIAKQIGVPIPPKVLARADRVIR
jgi:hypothetical protein